MNVSSSSILQNTNSTPSSAIGPYSKNTVNNNDGSDIPIAAIVAIVLFAYVVLMFICIALVRCYCGKQCSNVTCICCGNPEKVCCRFEGKNRQCCPNLPFASATACISCACCDQLLPKKDAKSCWKETDCVGLILCDKCLGPDGFCGQYYRVIEYKPHPVCQCDLCGGMDCHCNLDCDTINCLCFQIHRGGSMNPRSGQPYNNYNNNASTETVKQPPSLLTVSSTDSEVGLFQTNRSMSSSSDVKSTQTPRDLYPVVIDMDSSRLSRSARGMKTPRSVAPQSDRQLFSPRNLEQLKRKRAEFAKEITPRSSKDTARSSRNINSSARNVKKSPKRMTTPINERSEHLSRLDPLDSTSIIDLEHENNTMSIDNHMDSSVPGSITLNSESYKKHDSSKVISTRKLPIPGKSSLFTSSDPSNASSSVISTNPSHPSSSLSYTTEALLAQYQLMDASKITSASDNTA